MSRRPREMPYVIEGLQNSSSEGPLYRNLFSRSKEYMPRQQNGIGTGNNPVEGMLENKAEGRL